MKKLVFLTLALALICGACGSDEPDNPNKTARVQDGNGKVFLENGVLINANIDYTQEELITALSTYNWIREYCFLYDKNKISDKMDIFAQPLKMNTDLTMEYGPESGSGICDLTVSGKQITATMNNVPIYSSAIYPPRMYTIISMDLFGDSGRIVMDYKYNADIEGFDKNSLYVRMVWKAVLP